MSNFLAWIEERRLSFRYPAAIALAILAQVVRVPLHPAILPAITYVPFVVVSALAFGLWPGLVTTILCAAEEAYFAIEPGGTFVVRDALDWERVAVLLLTGLVASVMAGRLRRSGERLIEAQRKTASVLESISDGFSTFDGDWRYTFVNAASAKIVGRTREELLGKRLWELWPHGVDSPFGVACRRAVAENTNVRVEAYYREPLNAWFEARCYPSHDGVSLFLTNTTERKRRDEQLRLLESAFLQASAGTLIVKVSVENSCCQEPVFVNAAFERITGFNLADLRSGALAFLFSPLPNPHAQEQAMSRKDGSEYWAELTFQPLKDEHGNYTHCVWTIREITERKQADEASRLFGSIVENSDDAIISKTLDGMVVTWNKSAERIYGYSVEEMVGQPLARITPPDRAYELPEILDDLRRGARIEHFETERLRKDGSRICVSLTISPIQNSRGYVVGASVIARDITQHKLAEKELALSERRYRSLVFATAQVVWTTNAQGDVVDDTMLREFTGQGLEEMRGRGWMDALHPEDRDRIADQWSRSVKGRSFYDMEYRLRRHDGEYRWMAVHGVPVMEADGTIREWVGTCADIHDRKLAEEEVRKLNEELELRVATRTAELQVANQELESFAYSVSHDLRAPLRAVDGFSRILLEEYASQLPGEAQHYLSMARKNAVQMGVLIDDLLAFSRLSRQPLSKQPIAPAALVRQVIEDLRSEQDGRQVEILVGELPSCEGDPKLLKQVYVNLLSNGLKYTVKREIARIEVGSTFAPGSDDPVYYVRDNGVGFDMRYADKLFGVFQRLHGAQEYPGTGVGLAIVQRIVHRHGGRVWANAAVNEGATFYFVLSPAKMQLRPAKEGFETCPINP